MAEAKMGLLEGDTAERAFGLDVMRHWANGVQVTVAGTDAFVVFREQVKLQSEPNGPESTVFKNVTSVVMPMETAVQMAEIIRRLVIANTGEAGGDAAA